MKLRITNDELRLTADGRLGREQWAAFGGCRNRCIFEFLVLYLSHFLEWVCLPFC
jgi:hypothetical protein